jgi:hypothetical protein
MGSIVTGKAWALWQKKFSLAEVYGLLLTKT